MSDAVKRSGQWKNIVGRKVKVGGEWRPVARAWAHDGSGWVRTKGPDITNFFSDVFIDQFQSGLGNLDIDLDGNVYFVDLSYNSVTASYVLGRMDSVGNLVWQKRIDCSFDSNPLNPSTFSPICRIGSDGNIYVQLSWSTSPNSTSLTAKFDTAGNLIWYYGNSSDITLSDMAVDANNNTIALRAQNVWKISSDGDLVFSYDLNSSGGGTCVAAGAGNSFYVGQDFTSTYEPYSTRMGVLKANESSPGVVTSNWSYMLDTNQTASNIYSRNIHYSSSGHVYVVGFQYGATPAAYVVKMNGNGSVLWQKKITHPSGLLDATEVLQSGNEVFVRFGTYDFGCGFIVLNADTGAYKRNVVVGLGHQNLGLKAFEDEIYYKGQGFVVSYPGSGRAVRIGRIPKDLYFNENVYYINYDDVDYPINVDKTYAPVVSDANFTAIPMPYLTPIEREITPETYTLDITDTGAEYAVNRFY